VTGRPSSEVCRAQLPLKATSACQKQNQAVPGQASGPWACGVTCGRLGLGGREQEVPRQTQAGLRLQGRAAQSSCRHQRAGTAPLDPRNAPRSVSFHLHVFILVVLVVEARASGTQGEYSLLGHSPMPLLLF
jgi:hypothetical protein